LKKFASEKLRYFLRLINFKSSQSQFLEGLICFASLILRSLNVTTQNAPALPRCENATWQIPTLSVAGVSEPSATEETLKFERSAEWPDSTLSEQGRILQLKF
jgi:hypothetical protein